MSVGGNVEVKGLSRFTSVNNLYVSGTITTSGSMQLGQTLVDGDSDLILSSSSTSQVTISGNLRVLEYISGNLTPNKSNAHDLGDNTFYWRRIYMENQGSNNGGIWIKNPDGFQHGLNGGTVGGNMQVNIGTKLGTGGTSTALTVFDNATYGIGTYGGLNFEFGKVGMERLGSEFRTTIPIVFTTGSTINDNMEGGLDISSAGVLKITDGSTGLGALSGSHFGAIGQIYSSLETISTPTGTTQTIDWNNGNSQILDLESATGDVTLTLSNPKAGACYTLKIIQDSATARDVVWPASVLWAGGTTPTISTGANAVDVVSLFYDGTNYYANIGQNYS